MHLTPVPKKLSGQPVSKQINKEPLGSYHFHHAFCLECQLLMRSAHGPGPPMSHLPSDSPHTLSQFLESSRRRRVDVWDDKLKSKLVAGQGMSQVTGQTASSLLVSASGLLWPTFLGSCVLEPGLLQVSSLSMTKSETRGTRPHGTWLPEMLLLQLSPRAPSISEDHAHHTLNP